MKASEIVELLQELIELHGDCDVSVNIWDDEHDFERSSYARGICYNSEYKEFCIR